jgi:hypothetical protein
MSWAKPEFAGLGERVELLLGGLDRCLALDDAAASSFDELLELIPRLAGEAAERLCGREARLAALYGDYVRRRERDEVRALLAGTDPVEALRRGDGGLFAGRSFRRVEDLFERVDFTGCREFVMVGCGPLPVTLLHVCDRTRTPSIVGLELDADAASLAASVCGRTGRDRIRIAVADGCAYDFGTADVVYVANLVRPKRDVVARVAETARPGTRVVVREPFAAGALLAERGLDPLHAGLALLARGPGDRRFLSREVFLETRA